MHNTREQPQQGLANLGWRPATLVVRATPLPTAAPAAALDIMPDFIPQGPSNFGRALGTAELHGQLATSGTSEMVVSKLAQFQMQDPNNSARAPSYSGCGKSSFFSALRRTCLDRGRQMDQQRGLEPCFWSTDPRSTYGLPFTPLGYDRPDVVLSVPGLIVVFKPAGWETDVYDVAKFGVPITPVARYYLLSSFLAANFPEETFPICHSVEHGFGFVHRLDQMSSGLIITTTCFA
ncbi:unnamed protein product, partial [Polarella glacialis]